MHLSGPIPIINTEFEKRENYTDINGNFAEVGRSIKGEDIVLDKKDLVSGKLLVNEKLRGQAKEQMDMLKEFYNRHIYLF
jgi:hypothetical protein